MGFRDTFEMVLDVATLIIRKMPWPTSPPFSSGVCAPNFVRPQPIVRQPPIPATSTSLDSKTVFSSARGPLAELAQQANLGEPTSLDAESISDRLDYDFAALESLLNVADEMTRPEGVATYGEFPDGAVYALSQVMDFSGERGDHIDVAHSDSLELANGTIALTFTADNVDEFQGLFSKDAEGNRDGGHLSAFVYQGAVKVRLQSADESVWVKTAPGTITAGEEHHLAVTFGDDGLWLYVDGQLAAVNTEFQQGIENNTESLILGANGWGRNDDNNKIYNHFDGQIEGFTVYGSQLDSNAIEALAGLEVEEPLTEPTVMDGVLYGTDDDESLDAATHNVNQVHAGYGDDTVTGTMAADTLDGGHGEDSIVGGAGDDLIRSYADGREPVIAQDYTDEDDPNNEINDATRTYYPDQPIEADDVLTGGDGADTFYFRTLINAKRDIILKHVQR